MLALQRIWIPRSLQSTINRFNLNSPPPRSLPLSYLNNRLLLTIPVSPCFLRAHRKPTSSLSIRWSPILEPTPKPNSKKSSRAPKLEQKRMLVPPESKGNRAVHSFSPWIRFLSHRRVGMGRNWTRACCLHRARHSRFKHSISRAAQRACLT